MTNQSTIDKLIEMRLTTMADAFRNQLDDSKFKEVPFEDRFGMLVDIEYSNRKNNRQNRLIRNAGFDQPDASIMDINYTSGRKLNKDLINIFHESYSSVLPGYLFLFHIRSPTSLPFNCQYHLSPNL